MGSITYFLAIGTKALKGLQPSPLVRSQVTIRDAAAAPPWVPLSATRQGQHRSPFHSPAPRCLLPTGTAWGQPAAWPSHASDLGVRHWIHLTVSQLKASLRVRGKPSHFGFTDGEAEAQESAFCLGPRKTRDRAVNAIAASSACGAFQTSHCTDHTRHTRAVGTAQP